MTLETKVTSFSYDAFQFAQRVLQNPVIELQDGQSMTICGCMTQDLINVHDAIAKIDAVTDRVCLILNKFLLAYGYECEKLVCMNRPTFNFPKREFSLEGPITFRAKALLEEVQITSLMKTLSSLSGAFFTFPGKSIIVISGFTDQELQKFDSSEPAKSITVKLNQIVKGRYKFENQDINFFVGPPHLIIGGRKTRAIGFSKETCLFIRSNDEKQEIKIGFVTNEMFKKALEFDTLHKKEEKEEKVAGTAI